MNWYFRQMAAHFASRDLFKRMINERVVTLVCAQTLTFGYSSLISKTAKNMMPNHTPSICISPRVAINSELSDDKE